MPKAEWGTKRVCLTCGSRFYDFARTPVVCPSCNSVFDTEVLTRVRRSRPAARAAVVDEPIADAVEPDAEVDDVDEAVEAEDEEAVEVEEVADDDDEDALIEDASELGEDEDMSDVIEGDIDEEAR